MRPMVAVCGTRLWRPNRGVRRPTFLLEEGPPNGSCPGRCGAQIATVLAATTDERALQAAIDDCVAESRASSTTTANKNGNKIRWRRRGNALYFDARRSPPTLTVPRSRRRAQSLRADLRRRRGPPKAHCRFRVTQRRQQPQWARRAIAGVRGRTKQCRRYCDGSPACVGTTGGHWRRQRATAIVWSCGIASFICNMFLTTPTNLPPRQRRMAVTHGIGMPRRARGAGRKLRGLGGGAQ